MTMENKPKLKAGAGDGVYDVYLDGEKVGEVSRKATPHFGSIHYSWFTSIDHRRVGPTHRTRREAVATLLAAIQK